MMESATDQAMSCREPAALQAAALEAFDRANAADPNCETVDGVARPKELLYGRRMSDWLERLYPEATPALRLAVRCQHIERWQVPRKTYPEGRVGYLTWRRDLKALHAKRAGEILEDEGGGLRARLVARPGMEWVVELFDPADATRSVEALLQGQEAEGRGELLLIEQQVVLHVTLMVV